MIIVLPEWYGEARKKIDNCVDDIIRKNNIDWVFAHDSTLIKEAKETILMSLVRVYEKVGIEERKMMDEFEREQPKIKLGKSHKKKVKKNGKGSPNKNKN